ncbi:hypothetical protein D9V32_06710 [Mycetocola tolaasinivorans]|uniref:Uncharacterized protein n=1 Tax=Mycetocola tolaasinivorans TaxID=76635 RepID=A0A3L7A822_9MICO|nr:hypothetical protein [Mycetocola tolaasinivorans]RLP76536.1 hypothetical protein D9V32_06710 [Mycetocola tolaasinivorans]
MPDAQRITIGRVAEILRGDEIALNVGTDAGVAVDDRVVLFREIAITDPDSHRRLGEVQYPKLRLRVVTAEEQFCIARVTPPSSIPSRGNPPTHSRDGRWKSIAGRLYTRR